MVLLHGGGPGAEKIAASWAEKHHQQYDRHFQESRLIINYIFNINWL